VHESGSGPTASDVAVQANVGLLVNRGSGLRVLEASKMTSRAEEFHLRALPKPWVESGERKRTVTAQYAKKS
jgi:hypothetical protein